MILKHKYPLYEAVALLSSITLALFTYLQPGSPLIPGLDSSWAYALNFTFQHDLVIGKDIYFTFGPLGFLEHTRTLTISMLKGSSHFWFGCSITAFFFILLLCREAATNTLYLVLNIAIALVLIFTASDLVQRLLILLYASVFLHWRSNNLFYLCVMTMACVICMMIKFSYGMVALALYVPYLLALVAKQKPRQALLGLMLLLGGYFLLWFCIYGSFSGMAGYFVGGMEFSRGSTSAMALNPANHWPAIAGFYAAFVGLLLIVGRSDGPAGIIMPLCFSGSLLIWTKYALGREDIGHLGSLMSFAFYLGLLCVIASQSLWQKITCVALIGICFFTWKTASIQATGQAEFSPHLTYFPVETFRYRWNGDLVALKQIMDDESTRSLAPLVIDPELRHRIGSHTVDTYPWETLITAANNLNWSPRPVYQSYITYTPFLDQKNHDFYESSPKAPDYIIWHYHSFQEIDNRAPFSSDPLTLEAILENYTRLECKGLFCLWKRTLHKQLTVTNPVAPMTTSAWNTWITLPTPDTDVLRAHLHVERSLLGKLNMALWKEGEITIDYRLTNGETRTHTLLLDNAVSGLWVSPYRKDQLPLQKPELLTSQQVEKILGDKPAAGYVEKADTTPEGIHFIGWGCLTSQNTQTQHISLLLYDSTHGYRINAQNRSRPGITDYFGKKGIVDLESSGFDEIMTDKDITPGHYQVRFMIENSGESGVSAEMPLSVEVAKTSGTNRNVTAIRFRTTRPWAFTEAIRVDWSGLTFTKRTPW